MCEDGSAELWLSDVDAEGKHNDDVAGAAARLKVKGVGGPFLQVVDLVLCFGRGSRLLRIGAGIFVMEHRPDPHREDDSAGNQEDRDRDGRADDCDDGEEDDGVGSHSSGQGMVGFDRRGADKAEKYQGGAEKIDKRKEHAEADGEVFLEKIHSDLSRWVALVSCQSKADEFRDGFQGLGGLIGPVGNTISWMRPELKSL